MSNEQYSYEIKGIDNGWVLNENVGIHQKYIYFKSLTELFSYLKEGKEL